MAATCTKEGEAPSTFHAILTRFQIRRTFRQGGTLRIEDYALIGDTQAAGLVGRNGSIDWLCLPRFDSGACFAALLGDERHGRWLLRPRNEVRRTQRRYLPGTLVLETEFETDEGTV